MSRLISGQNVQWSCIEKSVEVPEATGVPFFVAQMFSFLETVRLQSGDAIAMAV